MTGPELLLVVCALVLVGLHVNPPKPGPPANPPVGSRFLEAPQWRKAGPRSRQLLPGVEEVRQWKARHPEAARYYVRPVLFPYDIVFMIALAGALAGAALLLAGSPPLGSAAFFASIAPPLLFVIADAAEDIGLRQILSPGDFPDVFFRRVRLATWAKLGLFALSCGEIFALAIWRVFTGFY